MFISIRIRRVQLFSRSTLPKNCFDFFHERFHWSVQKETLVWPSKSAKLPLSHHRHTHGGLRGVRCVKTGPPKKFFNFLYKMQDKKGIPPWNFFTSTRTPYLEFWENIHILTPLIFHPCASRGFYLINVERNSISVAQGSFPFKAVTWKETENSAHKACLLINIGHIKINNTYTQNFFKTQLETKNNFQQINFLLTFERWKSYMHTGLLVR